MVLSLANYRLFIVVSYIDIFIIMKVKYFKFTYFNVIDFTDENIQVKSKEII